MSRIRSENTKPEVIVRKYLYSKGIRYRLHNKNLPGKPDLSNISRKFAIFVNGCFWHRHENCKFATHPKTNIRYWKNKFKRNIELMDNNIKELKSLGFMVLIIWECEVTKVTILNNLTKTINEK